MSDGAGVLISEGYDFKGNLLHTTRTLRQDYKGQVNWKASPVLEESSSRAVRSTTR